MKFCANNINGCLFVCLKLYINQRGFKVVIAICFEVPFFSGHSVVILSFSKYSSKNYWNINISGGAEKLILTGGTI